MSLSERLRATMRIGLATAAIGLGGQAGYAAENQEANTAPVRIEQHADHRDYTSLVQADNEADKVLITQCIGMMAETKTGSELLDFLQRNGTKIQFAPPTTEWAGASYRDATNSIQLTKELLKEPLAFLWVLSHEAEHARHTTIEREKGYDKTATTLDDRYTSAVLHESLAERSGASVALEYLEHHPDLRSSLSLIPPLMGKDLSQPATRILALKGMLAALDVAHQKGDSVPDIVAGVFNRRLSLKETPGWDQYWQNYEKDMSLSKGDSPPRTPAEWNKIVSDISMGQVTELSNLPVVSGRFVRKCIESELRRDPNISSLSEMDLSCGQKNKEHISMDGNDIRQSIVSTLFEIQQVEEGTNSKIPVALQQRINAFLGVELSTSLREDMSWADVTREPEYQAKAAQAKLNLEKRSPEACLKAVSDLFNTPEGKSYLAQQPASETTGIKALQFMKEFFCSAQENNIMQHVLQSRVAVK